MYIYVCGHFKLVDSAISATPVADRCIKLSTQPCNLHIFEGVSTYFCIYRVSTNTIFTMCRNTGVVGLDMERTQEVGGTLIGEDGLIVMAGEELVEWYQIHQTWFQHLL